MKHLSLIWATAFAAALCAGAAQMPPIVPTPREWKPAASGTWSPARSPAITTDGQAATESVAAQLKADWALLAAPGGTSSPLPGGSARVSLRLVREAGLGGEGYRLTLAPEGATLTAATRTGLYWATRSLLQLVKRGEAVAAGTIADAPRYPIRGVLLDVGRKYFPLAYLRSIAREMAWYKLNEFHVHLSDDVTFSNFSYWAFRLECDTLPGLTAKDGSYSKREFRAFVKECATMGINVVPEIDTPAHAQAILKVRPELRGGWHHLDVENPKSIETVKRLFDEYLTGPDPVFAGPDVHVGTDEYGAKKAEAFRAYADALFRHIRSRGKNPRAWGSLSHCPGKTPVLADRGVTLDMWYNPFYQPQEALAAGYSLVSVPDRWTYIVPGASYYHDYLDVAWLYRDWSPNRIADVTIPADSPQLKGGKFAIWNDLVGNGITSDDVFDRFLPAAQVIAEKTWATASPRAWETFRRDAAALGEAPGENLADRLTPGAKAIGWSEKGGWTVDFEIRPDAPPAPDAAIFADGCTTVKLSQGASGKLGFSRDGYDVTFDYAVPTGRWTRLTLSGTPRLTTLWADGALVRQFAPEERYYPGEKRWKYSIYRTLHFPLARATENAFVGEIRNFTCARGAKPLHEPVPGNLLPDWGAEEPAFKPSTPGRNYTIKLKREWRGLHLAAEMKATDIRRGQEGWNTGRLTITFHDAKGRLAGRHYPLQQEVLGTTGWKKVDHDYLIPRDAVEVRIGFCNLGASGLAHFRRPSLVPTRGWITSPCDAPRPADATARLEVPASPNCSLDLSGWWRCRPSFTDEAEDFDPGAGDNWGWSRLPSVWDNSRKPFPATQILSPYFEDNEARLDLINPSRAWYATTLALPAAAKGRRVALRFTLVNTRVVAYVDERRAGEVTFPNGEIDLTPLVRPGREQTLALDVTAWPRNAVTREYNAPDRSDLKNSVVRLKGVTGDLFLDVTPPKTFVREAWTESDTAKGEVAFVVKAEGAETVKALRADVTDAQGRRHTFSGAARPIDRGSKSAVLALSAAWPDAPRWDLHTPGNLHRAEVTLLDGQGRALATSAPFTFGVRDVRLDGRRLLVNGTPLHLRALYGTFANNGLDHGSETNCLMMLGNARKLGFNFVIAGNYNMGEGTVSRLEGLLRAADKLGYFVSCTPPHIKQFGAKLDDPSVAEDYREMAERTISLWRNHPCVIACGMNHNCTGYGGDQNPMRLDGAHFNDAATRDAVGFEPVNRRNARLAGDICRRIDPTRTYYNHESGNLDRWYTLNIYLNWAPRQERSDWLEHWSKAGVKPLFFVEWGAPHIASWSSYRGPHFIWNTPGFQTCWAAEYAAAVLGDAAYEDSPEMRNLIARDDAGWATGRPRLYDTRPLAALTNLYNGVQAHYMADNWRAHRTWGITAALPWDQESFLTWWNWTPRDGLALTDVIRRWNQDDCAYIGGWDSPTDKRRNYSVGDEVRKNLVVINDRRVVQTVRWRCSLGADARQGEVRVGPGEVAFVPVVFPAPTEPAKTALTAAFTFADGVTQTDRFDVFVARSAPTAPTAKPAVALYDPKGRTTALLKRLGVAFAPTDLAARPDAKTRLVIGAGALTRDLLDRILVPFALGGGRALVFEQDKPTLESCGFRVQEYGLRAVFPRYVSPALGALEPEALRDWAGASTLVPPDYEATLPAVDRDGPYATWAGFRNTRVWRCGNRNAVATVLPEKPTLGDWRALADGGFDLQYAPLLEWHVNCGSVTFCQLDVTARTVPDPAADALARRLVAALGAGAERGRWPLPFGAAAHRAALKREMAFARYYNATRPETGANGYFITSGAKLPPDFAERIRQGASALCVGLSAAEVKALSPVPLAVADTNACVFSRIARLPAELNGLSNADWAWHGAMDFAAFTDPVPDGNNAFRVVTFGKGKLVFMQVAPWMIDDETRPQLRTSRRRAEHALSRLLWNVLGAECRLRQVLYADTPEATDDPYRYIRW